MQPGPSGPVCLPRSAGFTRTVSQTMEALMARVPPFHSKRETDRKVYHDSDQCTEGNNIETSNRVPGTGGRPLCDHCARLG